jgi:hypothetical protein
LTPAALAGLLADGDRRRVVAALVLGASSEAEVRSMAGLGAREAGTAVARLVDGGLVVRGDGGYLALVEEAFPMAARAAAVERRSVAVPEAEGETGRVLRAFVRDGRLVSIPAQRSKRLVVLELLAQEFEPGRRYSEAMVNLILGKWHPDTAALRRYLVDEELLSREAGEYWRSGGPFDVSS